MVFFIETHSAQNRLLHGELKEVCSVQLLTYCICNRIMSKLGRNFVHVQQLQQFPVIFFKI